MGAITYGSEDAANGRVRALRRIGLWPAVIPQADGRWRLSVDLPGTVGEIAAERGLPDTRPKTAEHRDRRVRGQS
jgi:hypothetical protein